MAAVSSDAAVVVAVGGNALARRGQRLDWATQQANAAVAAAALAPIAARHRLVVVHGNGPQVGLLALGADAVATLGGAMPLDALDAESEGMIGYLLAHELDSVLAGQETAVLLTRVVVAADDLGFTHPTKFVGQVLDEATAQRMVAERGWSVAADGDRWRRVVASPEPQRIVELHAVRTLLDAGVVVVCGGGGGIPVVDGPDGHRLGVEAVIDKDLTAALIATELGADRLVVLTDVDGVHDDHGLPTERLIRRATPAELRARSFPAGSMGPKVDAACRFVERTGRAAAIGSLDDAAAVAAGDAGTVITASVTTS
jgi:carbamate kinase